MIPIHIVTPGDSWTNATEVYHKLLAIDPDLPVALDFKHEGPSISALGIADTINQYCARVGRNPNTVFVTRYLNGVDTIPYKNKSIVDPLNHFFSMSKDYWTTVAPVVNTAQQFGFFMGRRTFARGRILYDLYHQGNTLLSTMNSQSIPPWTLAPNGINLEKLEDWLTNDIVAWLTVCPVVSLDGHAIKDQYSKNPQTNQSITAFYNQFCCEIVAETFTLGKTFFPTEKTIRPVMAAKPMLVYGPRNFLKGLRNLGFETYRDCWDETYDQLEGPDRWTAIKEIMPTVVVDNRALKIAQCNRQHLAELIKLKC